MSVTLDYDDYPRVIGPIRTVRIDWQCDASGDYAETTEKISGRLVKGVTNPSAASGLVPTDNYDIVLTDEDGVNILANCDDDLLNRDETNSEEVYFFVKNAAAAALAVHPIVNGEITVTVAAAGNITAGSLVLYIENPVVK